jgi:hypothetical protein
MLERILCKLPNLGLPAHKAQSRNVKCINLICLFRVPWNNSNFHHRLFWFTEGLCSIGRKRPVPSDLSETVRHRQGLLAGLSGAPRSPALLSGRVVISDHGTPPGVLTDWVPVIRGQFICIGTLPESRKVIPAVPANVKTVQLPIAVVTLRSEQGATGHRPGRSVCECCQCGQFAAVMRTCLEVQPSALSDLRNVFHVGPPW